MLKQENAVLNISLRPFSQMTNHLSWQSVNKNILSVYFLASEPKAGKCKQHTFLRLLSVKKI